MRIINQLRERYVDHAKNNRSGHCSDRERKLYLTIMMNTLIIHTTSYVSKGVELQQRGYGYKKKFPKCEEIENDVVLVSLLLTLNILNTFFWYFCCSL